MSCRQHAEKTNENEKYFFHGYPLKTYPSKLRIEEIKFAKVCVHLVLAINDAARKGDNRDRIVVSRASHVEDMDDLKATGRSRDVVCFRSVNRRVPIHRRRKRGCNINDSRGYIFFIDNTRAADGSAKGR